MHEKSLNDEKLKYPSFGLEAYFSSKFTNTQFEYGSNQFGVCRYPLDENGQRIVEILDYGPQTLGMDGGTFDKSETIVLITSHKGDTPNSIYFKFNPDIIDTYSNQFDDLSCPNITAFINRITQHMELINKVATLDNFELFKSADFNVFFNFKYDHTVKHIFRTASIAFNSIIGHEKRIVFTATNNMLTTMSSLRKMDTEFFNRYYKHKIVEAMPDLSSDQIYDLMDISNWPESLKTLVKISHY